MLVNIGCLRESETIDYAAEELKKYLERMDQVIQCQIVKGIGDITLGNLNELSLPDDDVEDDMIDDVIDIRVEFLRGYIAGSNDRSVLMGVYEFLKSGGCMWVRPGKTGEYIPQADMHQHSFAFRKKADLSFRGECIEGAVSYENVRDHILWLPKVNMNLFMLEMVVPYTYFSRWYKHTSNTEKEAEDLPYEEYCNFTHKLELLIRKLGLQLHSLGHGYLFEPFGVRYKSPNDYYELPAEAVETVAMLNGKREYYDHSPNYTQICMSNDKARLGLVNFLVKYLEQKPQIDFLHVWLSDAANNHCECENCQKMIPSDFYVQMLNELDAELTKRNMKTRIVFIMYTDTFWAPEKNKLNNPGRFIMTTAAFRDYARPYCFDRGDVKLQPYKRNQLSYSADFEHTLARMDLWSEAFHGRRFLFEYHLYTDHFYDPGYMEIARNMWADIQALRKEDFDGMMNDQTQRCFFPTGLPVSVMGEGMFDRSMDFDAYVRKYFSASFGVDGEKALHYLEQITKLFNPKQIRTRESIVFQDTGSGGDDSSRGVKNNPYAAERFEKIPAVVDAFFKTVQKNLNADNSCHKTSWMILFYHGEYCKRLANIYHHFAQGDVDRAKDVLMDMMQYLSEIEDEIQPYFDLFLFHRRLSLMLR